jgi:hypothetical protein
MHACGRCEGSVADQFRYCPWCAAPQRLKIVEFFRSHSGIEADRGRSLRVSRYLAPARDERHVRFSVWSDQGERAEAEAAVSLDDPETRRLAGFLLDTEAPAQQLTGLRLLVEQLRLYLPSRR